MELLYAEVVAVVLGLLVHAALPRREQTGVLLLPAVAGAAGAIVWVALTWAGVAQDSPWIWLASLAAAVLSAAGIGVPLRRARAAADRARLASVGPAAGAARAARPPVR